MIIRSQNKESIINFDRVDTVRLSRCTEKGVIKEHYQTNIFFETADTRWFLGTYSTEEKAIKVLDMICNFADKLHLEKLQSNLIRTDGTVFQMPLDEDVEV